jgi:hypothetical protein
MAVESRECEAKGCWLVLPAAVMARMESGEWRCPVDDPTGMAWPGRSAYYRQHAREVGDDRARGVVKDDVEKLMDVFVEGERGGGSVVVRVGGLRRPLNPRLDLMNHSPTGFSWGYGGSGAAQLALALAAWVLEDDRLALDCYQGLKWKLVAQLPFSQPWRLSYWDVVAAVKAVLAEQVAV